MKKGRCDENNSNYKWKEKSFDCNNFRFPDTNLLLVDCRKVNMYHLAEEGSRRLKELS